MDYSCAKFGDFSFSCLGYIMRRDRQNTESDQRYTHATAVGVSKARFPLPKLTARVDGPSTRLVETGLYLTPYSDHYLV